MSAQLQTPTAPPSQTQDVRVRAHFDRLFPQRALTRVLLVTPPDATASLFDAKVARRGTYSNFPPYGHAVLAQKLRAIGVEVEILNLNQEVLRRCHEAPVSEPFDFDAAWRLPLSAALTRFKPQLVGVTCMFTMTHDSMKAACDLVAEARIPVIIGGVHVSNDVERILDEVTSADLAIVREGDVAFPRLIQIIRGTEPANALRQTIVRDDGQGRLRFSEECVPTQKDMDVIPAFELIDVANLSRYGVIGSFHCFKPKGTRFSTSLSNRGCRAQCTFCSVRNFNGEGVRQRSVDSVLDELQELEEVHGIEHLMWLDDDLLKDHARAISLFNGMVRRNLKMTWDASNGVIAASCTDEVVAAAAASRCIALIIGMESGNTKILRDVKKPGTVGNFIRAAEVLRKYPTIYTGVYLIVGFPGETMKMIKDTMRVSSEMNLDWFRIKTLQPLVGTPIYEAMKEQGLLEAKEKREVRYVTGAYGRPIEDSADSLPPASILEVFDAIPDHVIPSHAQLDDIWFYMNYAMNYHRIIDRIDTTSIDKLRQHRIMTTDICDVISPDNPFALYTSVLLTKRLDGTFDKDRFDRLQGQLSSSPFWSKRFQALGLSPSNLS
jgi:radical SAM superfamily enzyme YgiQ (UPF0313 family)